MQEVCSDIPGHTSRETGFLQGGQICPICGEIISEEYLPDINGFVDERLYWSGEIRITSGVTLECDFFHFFNEEEGLTLEEPHLLTAEVEAFFDQTGKCLTFNIVEIRKKE